jgi:hypothetical protein
VFPPPHTLLTSTTLWKMECIKTLWILGGSKSVDQVSSGSWWHRRRWKKKYDLAPEIDYFVGKFSISKCIRDNLICCIYLRFLILQHSIICVCFDNGIPMIFYLL